MLLAHIQYLIQQPVPSTINNNYLLLIFYLLFVTTYYYVPPDVSNYYLLLTAQFVGLRGGADKSLARPTSRCRRTESIVSLERGVCSCAELQVFSCYRGWNEAGQATRAILTTSRCELSSSFFFLSFFLFLFFFLLGKAPKEIHAILAETLGEHAPSYATVKNWVAQFKRGDFSTCDAPRPGWPKTVTTPVIIDQIHELILEDRRILAK